MAFLTSETKIIFFFIARRVTRVLSNSEAYSAFLVRMVKLVQQSWWKFSTCFLRVSSSSYSTNTETLASLFLPDKDEQASPKNALNSRLLYLTRSKDSVISVLDKWVTEQNPIKYEDLQIIVRQFRAYRRYNHALQVCLLYCFLLLLFGLFPLHN